jgi:hypothetical protein
MRVRLRFILPVLSLALLLALPAMAHKVVLKTGRVIQFDKYRVQTGVLYYIDGSGREIRIPLGDINMDRTKQLSANDTPPLDLTDLAPPKPVPPPHQLSLGELAEKVRPPDATLTSQRVFTDDDVEHDSSDENGHEHRERKEDFNSRIGRARKLISRQSDKTARELGDDVVKDVQFPGREEWEHRLFEQNGKVVRSAQDAVDAAERISGGATERERDWARKTAEDLLSDFDSRRQVYDDLVTDGVRRSNEWVREHE